MLKVVLIVGVLLLVVILVLIFRINTLFGVVKRPEKKIESLSNKINGILFLVFLVVFGTLFFWYSYTYFDEYTIPLASEHGAVTDNLFWITTAVTGVAFIILHVLLFYFPFKYHYKEDRKVLFYADDHKLELIWTVIPAIVLSILVFTGLKAWSDITSEAPSDSEIVEIMGYQFAWKLRYPGGDDKLGSYDYRLTMAINPMGVDFTDQNSLDDFSPGQMYLPKGKHIKFQIRARDVLHSVYSPHFRLKMDAVPGMPTSFWFIATKTTEEMRLETGNPDFNYEIACAEICGQGHFSMRLIVVVLEPDQYKKWKSEQQSIIQREPDLMRFVPDNLKELALIKSGLEKSLKVKENINSDNEVSASM